MPVSPAIVNDDEAGDWNDSTPEPLVVRICPLLPSAAGNCSVKLEAMVAGAFKFTKLEPSASFNVMMSPRVPFLGVRKESTVLV